MIPEPDVEWGRLRVPALHLYVVFADELTVSSPTSRCKLPINIAPVVAVRELPQEVPPEHDNCLGSINTLIKRYNMRLHQSALDSAKHHRAGTQRRERQAQ